MKNKRRIYCLGGLSEEALAVCFAKCSRSAEAFDVIAKDLSDEKSSKFHEKWVLSYGHSSVAEHAVIRLAMENISLLAVEWIQDNRLASYTEKSSRYQLYDKNRYVIPKDIKRDGKILRLYKDAVDKLLDTYREMIDPLEKHVLAKGGKGLEVSKVRGMVMDQARFLLPACMMANLGMTANARVWEYAVSKWLSSGVGEVVELAEEVKKEIKKSCPTLVKYAAKNKYLEDIYSADFGLPKDFKFSKNMDRRPVRVVDWDKDALDKIVTSLIYKKGQGEYKKIRSEVARRTRLWKSRMLKRLLKNRSEHDRLPRDFEHIYISFDILCDQGAYYDFKRNRMMTQIRQDLGVENGYILPKMIKEIGWDDKYDEAIKRAEDAYFEIRKKYPVSAQYLVTKAHNRRFLMKMNLRELFYFVRLRARRAGNFAYRRIAMAILEETKKKYPEIMKLFFEEKELDSREGIEKEFFSRFV